MPQMLLQLRLLPSSSDWHARCWIGGMATRTKRPSEAWTVPLHIVVWAAILIGFIMAAVVLLMH